MIRRNIDGEQWELLRDNVPSLISAVSHRKHLWGESSGRFACAISPCGTGLGTLFRGLGSASAFSGRNFSEDEDRPHGPKTAILSYALWRTVFGANPSVLGQAMLLKGEPYTIIGVLPESATTPLNADLYTALQPSREGEGMRNQFSSNHPAARRRELATGRCRDESRMVAEPARAKFCEEQSWRADDVLLCASAKRRNRYACDLRCWR